MVLRMNRDKMVTFHHGIYYIVYLRTISNNCRRHFHHFNYHDTTRPPRYMMNKIHLYHFYIIFIYRILLNLFSSWI